MQKFLAWPLLLGLILADGPANFNKYEVGEIRDLNVPYVRDKCNLELQLSHALPQSGGVTGGRT